MISPETFNATISENKYVIYSIKNCKWCVKAKEYIEKRGDYVREIVLDRSDKDFEQSYDYLFAQSGGRCTFPWVFIDGNFIGGYDDLLKELPSRIINNVETETLWKQLCPLVEDLVIDIVSDAQVCGMDTDGLKSIQQKIEKLIKKSISQPVEPEPKFKKYDRDEWMLQESQDRFVILPIVHEDIWEFYKKAEACFWTVEEIDMELDRRHWLLLSKDDQNFIIHVMAFFSGMDGVINENMAMNFYVEIQIPEARCFWGFQIAIENIHNELYSEQIDAAVRDPVEKERVLNAFKEFPSVQRMMDWCITHMDREKASFAHRLLVFAIVEGVMFSGAFCAIFWLRKRNLMPGITFANELISRDEGLHTDFACLIYRKLKHRLPEKKVHSIFKEGVEICESFIGTALPVKLIGMNEEQMCEYIRFCADRLLISLGYSKLFHSKNPFNWMETISIQAKSNFFEKRVAEYSKAGIDPDKLRRQRSDEKKEEDVLNFDDDFDI